MALGEVLGLNQGRISAIEGGAQRWDYTYGGAMARDATIAQFRPSLRSGGARRTTS